jgi:capsular exopolysaccharide synthesis family protein
MAGAMMDTQRSAEEMAKSMTPYSEHATAQGQQPHYVPMTTAMADAANNLLIDLPLLWAVFRRRMGLFIGGALVVLALVTLVTFQLTPKYQAEATVLIDQSQKSLVDFTAGITGLTGDSATVDTEVQLIGSRVIAQRVTEKLDLYNDVEFNAALAEEESGIKGFIKGLFPSQVNVDLNTEEMQRIEREKTVDAVINNLDVERVGVTYIIAIRFQSEDPAKAARIANAFADQYLVNQLDAKFDYLRRAQETLNVRTAELQEDVREAEAAVDEYRTANNLFESEGSSLTEQRITDIQTQLISQRAVLAERLARLNSLNEQRDRGVSVDSIAEVLASPVIGELRANQADLARRKSELEIVYGPRHPEMLKVVREEEDLSLQIEAEVARIVANLESEVEIARNRVQSFERELRNTRSELADNNKALVKLRELERVAETRRATYESMLKSFQETGEQEALTENDSEIASEATIPTSAAFPNKLLNIALGMILGAGFGALLVVLAEIFDNGLRTAEDIERTLNTKLITAIPILSKGLLAGKMGTQSPQDYLVDKPLSAFAESYRTIRSSILLAGDNGSRPRVVAVTSALSGEGKTVSSLCLGRICAMSGDKVIVIDCDARRRILSGSVNGGNIGLLEVLTGNGALKDAIRKDAKTNLHILPISGAQEGVADVFGSNAFDSLISKLKTKYDLIILDTAPVTAVADTRTIICAADMAILAVRWRTTPVKIARSAMKILNELSTPVKGALLTQVNARSQTQYGYEGSYAYYSSHKNYYHD